MRKILCLMLSIILIFTLALPALAEDSGSQTPAPASDPAPCTHAFGSWAASGGTHSRSCTLCGTSESADHTWNEGTVTTNATCTDAGAMTYSCTGCGTTKNGTVDPRGHSFGSWTSVDGSNHQHACTVCGTTESAGHSWNEGVVTTNATCVAAGVKTYTCTGCSTTKTEAIPISTTHAYGEWGGDENTHSRTCTLCGKSESGSHSFGAGVTTVTATCLEEGLLEYPCATCGGVLYVILPKLTTHTYDNVCDPDCNICGAIRDAKHTYSAVWARNSKQHWHACTACGDKQDIGSHYPGPAATEEKAQICLTCGLTLTAKLNHTHKYSTTWTADETGHWYDCDGCEEQKDFEEHSYDDPCDPDCNTCGYRTATNHAYDGKWSITETGHWSTCTICGEAGEEESHIPGSEATETEAQVCITCGFELAPALEHVHEPGENWVTDEESHWHDCECGEKVDEAPHAWDAGTENEDTTITYVCTECQAEKTEGEPKVESDFPWLMVVLIAVILICIIGATVALVLVLRSDKKAGKFHR